MCRGVLEQLEHNVDTFISLSSPQSGQFGGELNFVTFYKNRGRGYVTKGSILKFLSSCKFI